TAGVSTVGGTLVAYKAETATLTATDGTHSTASTGGTGVSLTVSPAAASAYRITAASTTPTAGATDALTITQVDPFQNVETGLTGPVSLTFAGLGTAGSGAVPTVTRNGGSPIILPYATLFRSTAGVSTVGGTLVAYKAEAATLTATDGTHSTGSTGGT